MRLVWMLALGVCHFPANAGPCGDSLVIWFQPGVGDSDRLLADWPQLATLLQERRIGWTRLDCSAGFNTFRARAQGIGRLPAFVFRGRRIQGYAGLPQLLAQLGIESRPPGETPTYTPPLGEQAPEVVDLQTFQTAIRRFEADQQRQDEALQAALSGWKTIDEDRVDEFAAGLVGVRSELVGLTKQGDLRWEATQAGIKALVDAQDPLADLDASSDQPAGRSTDQPATPQNKELKRTDPPKAEKHGLGWAGFLARAGKIGLAIAAPEVSLPLAGLSAAAGAAGWLVSRRRNRSAGRSEVRPDERFQPVHGEMPRAESGEPRAESTHQRTGGSTPKPGPWQRVDPHEKRNDAGVRVRSIDGGPVPDRFPAAAD